MSNIKCQMSIRLNFYWSVLAELLRSFFIFSTMHKPDMASFFVSEENPAAMAASGSMKIVFNFPCFSTSLLAALLPFLPLLPFFNIWAAIVSQVLALKARKPNPIRQLMLVSTALAVSVPWMLVYQVYFIILMLYKVYLILAVQSSRTYERLSLFNLSIISALLLTSYIADVENKETQM